jgi:benzoate membrane transport protein
MIPPGIAAGLLAGILLRFGIGAFGGAGMDPLLVGALILTYALLRRFTARYAIVGVLIAGIALLLGMGQVSFDSRGPGTGHAGIHAPAFSMTALLSVAFPCSSSR